MKKIILSVFVILSVLLFQNCKKSDVAAAATTPPPVLEADIDGGLWLPDTLSANITYTAATKAKVFTVSGTKSQKQVTFALTMPNAASSADFTIGTYKVDDTNNLVMVYSKQQLNAQGTYVFVPFGTVQPAGGTVSITAVDAVNKAISGTFSLSARVTNYDTNNNVVSVTTANVTNGSFNGIPYTFTSK